MASTINSLDAFKKFSSARIDLSASNGGDANNSPVAGQQMFIQGSQYNFREDNGTKTPYNRPAANYVKVIKAKTGEKPLKSKMLANDPITKFVVELKKTKKLPEYAYRGMKGDPNANFYEYLSLSKIPYYIGGAMLTAAFAMGITKHDYQARQVAIEKTKQIATGVLFYYLGTALAKKVIDVPVKFFRGIDLNHPYENVVDCRADSKTGHSPKKVEYHKVPESVDFTRWDLMYGDESKKNGKAVNEKFDELAGKFGIDKNLQDSDATLKGKIKALIVSATAFKYMLTVPFVTLGLALTAQKDEKGELIWGNVGKGLKENLINIKNMVKGRFNSDFKKGANIGLGVQINPDKNPFRQIFRSFAEPMKKSCRALWGSKEAPNKLGRALILTSAIAPVLANLRILQLSSVKHNNFVDIREYIPLVGRKQDKSQEKNQRKRV